MPDPQTSEMRHIYGSVNSICKRSFTWRFM